MSELKRLLGIHPVDSFVNLSIDELLDELRKMYPSIVYEWKTTRYTFITIDCTIQIELNGQELSLSIDSTLESCIKDIINFIKAVDPI